MKESNFVRDRYFLFIILLVTFLLYFKTLGHDFTNRDDDTYITENPLIKDGSWQGFLNLFTTPYSWNYHPLTALSNWVEYKFGGMNPKPFHFINIILHLLNTVLVYRFIWMLKSNGWVALITALLFAIHPMHVESVAWLSERKDLLYTLFALLSLLLYVKYLEESKIKYLVLAGLFFFCSLMSKSAAVVVPVLFFLIDYYKERKLTFKTVLEKTPFFMLSLGFGILALLTQKTAIQSAPDYTLVQKFFLVNYAISFYIVKMFLPIQLCAMYSYPKELTLAYYLSPLLIFSIIFLAAKTTLLKRDVIFGILFYFVSVFLVVQIISLGDAVVSERYSYLSYIGLFFIFSTVYVEKIIVSPHLKKIIQPVLIVLVVLLIIQTWNRNKVWKNSRTLWKDVVEKNPGSQRAYQLLGGARSTAGDYEGAIEIFSKGIALDTGASKELYHDRAITYSLLENNKAAIADLSVLIKKWPDAFAYTARGALLNKNKEWRAALLDLDKAILLDSGNYENYWERGMAKYNLNNFQDAINDYDKALLIKKEAAIYSNRGIAYYQLNEKEKACDDWKISAEMGYEQSALYIRDYCK